MTQVDYVLNFLKWLAALFNPAALAAAAAATTAVASRKTRDHRTGVGTEMPKFSNVRTQTDPVVADAPEAAAEDIDRRKTATTTTTTTKQINNPHHDNSTNTIKQST